MVILDAFLQFRCYENFVSRKFNVKQTLQTAARTNSFEKKIYYFVSLNEKKAFFGVYGNSCGTCNWISNRNETNTFEFVPKFGPGEQILDQIETICFQKDKFGNDTKTFWFSKNDIGTFFLSFLKLLECTILYMTSYTIQCTYTFTGHNHGIISNYLYRHQSSCLLFLRIGLQENFPAFICLPLFQITTIVETFHPPPTLHLTV